MITDIATINYLKDHYNRRHMLWELPLSVLRNHARKLRIKGAGRMPKHELIDLLS